jgi:outer membrane lipoprotein SlyB
MLKNSVFILLMIFLSGCNSLDRIIGEERDSGSYSNDERGSFSRVTEGKIVSIKQIKLAGSKGLGATFGAALVGLAGSSITDRKYNKEALTAIGALAGTILGSKVEEFTTKSTGYEFLIDTKDGIKAFVDVEKQDLKTGDSVYIVYGNGPIRISKK